MKELTIYEYKLLPDHEQYDLVFREGQFINHYLTTKSKFALYALFKFFVEVEYDSNNNKIIGKVSFISGDILDKYSDLKW